MIRIDEGMSTARFCELLDIPERTWRRRQARARAGQRVKGPWPAPARDQHRAAVAAMANQHPAWGHRKIWAMVRHDGHQVSPSTVLRIMADEGLLLRADYQRQRRELAKQRKAAFAAPPTGPNQVWQLDFSEYETTGGGTWRVAGVVDYFSKYEFGWHWSPTANQHDAIAGVKAPTPSVSSSTPSARTNTSRGTGPQRSTTAWPTRPSPPFPHPKSCQLLDAGHVAALHRHGLRGSMGRVATCADNTAIESFWALLQKNVLSRHRWTTREQLRTAIVTWIERIYHRRRRRRQARLG